MDAVEQQSLEIEALEAIYDKHFERREKVWGRDRFAVTIFPGESVAGDAEEAYTRTVLVVTYTAGYPSEVPILELENVRGLTTEEKEELGTLVKAEAGRLAELGDVMVYELVTAIKDFLERHNRQALSGYEEMLARQEKAKTETVDKEARLKALDAEALAEELEEAQRRDSEALARLQRLQARAAPEDETTLVGHPSLVPQPVPEGGTNDRDGEERVEELLQNLADRDKSRWETDFKELGQLGRGGFGEVVRARNRFDKSVYAVKKVLASAAECQKILEEVVSLKRLEHPSIVRYYSAWIEKGADGPIDEEEDLDAENREAESASSSSSEGSALLSDSPHRSNPFQDLASEGASVSRPSNADDDDEDDNGDDEDDDEEEDEEDEEEGRHAGLGWIVAPTSISRSGGLAKTPSSAFDSSSGSDDSDTNSTASTPQRISRSTSSSLPPARLRALRASEDLSPWMRSTGLSASDMVPPPPASLSAAMVSPLDMAKRKRRRRVRRRREWCLYIQMEYCGMTLRQIIDDGQLYARPREYWRFFRQILEALDHIHKRGCIHRDLKPGNIFLSDIGGRYTVRVGDFGLLKDARKGDSGAALGPRHRSGADMTGGVGTAFYRAPEQEDTGSYNEAADLFSCGIVLFEMAHPPFRTAMERAMVLQRLREGELPRSLEQRLDEEDRAWQRRRQDALGEDAPADEDPSGSIDSGRKALEIIPALLSREPSARPSAEALLVVGAFPVEEEVAAAQRKDLVALCNHSNASFPTLMASLFEMPPREGSDLLFDKRWSLKNHEASAARLYQAALRQHAVCAALRRVFEAHGAVALSPPLLLPRSGDDVKRNDAHLVPLIDGRGTQVLLPDNLTVPMARLAARLDMSGLKRYQIGRIFCRGGGGGGAKDTGGPLEALEADFDVLMAQGDAPDAAAPDVCEAEVVLVCMRALTAFRSAAGPYALRLTHAGMSVALFELLGVHKAQRPRARGALSAACDACIAGRAPSDAQREALPPALRGALLPRGASKSAKAAAELLDALRDAVEALPQVAQALAQLSGAGGRRAPGLPARRAASSRRGATSCAATRR